MPCSVDPLKLTDSRLDWTRRLTKTPVPRCDEGKQSNVESQCHLYAMALLSCIYMIQPVASCKQNPTGGPTGYATGCTTDGTTGCMVSTGFSVDPACMTILRS